MVDPFFSAAKSAASGASLAYISVDRDGITQEGDSGPVILEGGAPEHLEMVDDGDEFILPTQSTSSESENENSELDNDAAKNNDNSSILSASFNDCTGEGDSLSQDSWYGSKAR